MLNIWPAGTLNSWLVLLSRVRITAVGGFTYQTLPVTVCVVVMVLGMVVVVTVLLRRMPTLTSLMVISLPSTIAVVVGETLVRWRREPSSILMTRSRPLTYTTVPLTVFVVTEALPAAVSTSVLTCALILREVARQTAPATITSQVAFTFIVFLLVAVFAVWVCIRHADKWDKSSCAHLLLR